MSEVAYDDALAAVHARLGHKGAKHSERSAKAAAALALVYGVDPDAARLAGLLHDWDRECTADELLGTARHAGLAIDESDVAVPRLLHARTGAVHVREEFPELGDEIVQAIARHTVGASGMSELDMVVYLADMIEPHRDYPGVAELRDAVGQVPLRELFCLGYVQTLQEVVDRRKRIHPDTVTVWNEYVAGDRR